MKRCSATSPTSPGSGPSSRPALVWLATIAFTGGQGGGELLTAALTFATFFVIVGIGQMFVITLGPGNVDLSIPATITLAGSVAMKIMDTQDSMILVGLLAALACGLAVGIFNYALILDPAHPADHRDAVVELRRPVDGDRLWPRAPHQAAAAARRFHHRADRRHPGARRSRRPARRAHGRGAPPHRLWPVGHRHRPEHARRRPRRHQGRAHPLPDLCAERAARRACAAICSPASPAARRCRWASNTCSPRSPWSSSAARRSPAATPICPACGARRCSCSCPVDAEHLPAFRRSALPCDRSHHHRRDHCRRRAEEPALSFSLS